MITSSNRLQPALQNLLQRVVRFYHPRLLCPTHISEDVCGGRKSLIKPVTRQNISNCSVLSSEIVMSVDVQRITLNALFMTISGERTEQLDIYSAASQLALRVIFSVSQTWNLFGSFTEPFNCD